VVLLYIVIQQFESLVLIPLIMKQRSDANIYYIAVVVSLAFLGFRLISRYSTIDCVTDLVKRSFGQGCTE